MDTPTLRVTEPREMLSFIPYQLGFHPSESVVAVSLRPPRGRVGLAVRVDLPDLASPEDGPQLAREVVAHLDGDGADRAVLVVYTRDDPRRGPDPVVAAAVAHVREAAEAPYGEVPAWAVTSTGYLSLDCPSQVLDIPMTNAVIYTRLSKDRTGEGAGVERQETECRELAARLGLVISRVYSDNDISATNGKRRPAFEQMLKDKPAVIVAWHQDRLLRVSKDLEKVLDLGATVHTVSGGSLDLSSPTGQAVARTVAAWSTFETQQKAKRQKAANRQKVAQGRPLWSRVPFGYAPVLVKIDERTTKVVGWSVVEDQAQAIREAYARVLDGDSNMASLAREWNDKGFRNSDGNPWSGLRVRACLLNGQLAGLVIYKGSEQPDAKATWEPIVDAADYFSIRAILTDPARGAGGHPRSHPLSGVYRCSVCGSPCRAFWRKRVKGVQLTWRCARMHVCVLDDTVRPLVEEQILEYATRDGIRQPRPATGLGDEARAALQARRGALVARLDQAADAVVRDTITVPMAEKITAKTLEEMAEIDRQLAEPQEKHVTHLRTVGEISEAMMQRSYLERFDIRLAPAGQSPRVLVTPRP